MAQQKSEYQPTNYCKSLEFLLKHKQNQFSNTNVEILLRDRGYRY